MDDEFCFRAQDGARKKTKKRLRVTQDFRDAVLNTDVTFVVVATPSDADGSFSNKSLEESLTKIGLALKDKRAYHLVVVTSTVMPGSTDHVARFMLEETSRKKCGRDFSICYNPEFIALGSVIRDFLNPDMILIGQNSKKEADSLKDLYLRVCDNKPFFARMSILNAEKRRSL